MNGKRSDNWGGLDQEAAKKAGIRGKTSTFKDKAWVHTSRTLYITNVAADTSTEELEGVSAVKPGGRR